MYEPETLDLLSAVADFDVSKDEFVSTTASFQYTCKGAEWCAVVAAHTDAVHRLATIDITSDCGVTTGELSNLTIIATEKAGLQICFQVATCGDAQREHTLRLGLEMCEFRRLKGLYHIFLAAAMAILPVDGENTKSTSHSQEDDYHPVDKVFVPTINSHSRVGEDRRQLVAEFETTLEDMQSMQFQKEQQIQHLASQLDEERRCNAQHVADLQKQLVTMRLDHTCLDNELDSISAALLETQESCNLLRQLVSENEERHRYERQKAQREHTTLQEEYATLVDHYETQLRLLRNKSPEAHVPPLITKYGVAATVATNTNTQFDNEITTARDEHLFTSTNHVFTPRTQATDNVNSNNHETRAAAELDAAALVEARDALEAARRRCAELDAARAEAVAARAEAVAALEAKNTAAESEMAAARDAIRAAEERAVAADAERARVVAELEGKARAAEREAAAARAEQEAAVSCTRGIVEAVRNEYQTHAAAELDAAALVEARDALEAARRRCAELDAARAEAVAARAEAVAALEAKSTAAESEMAAARDAIRAAEERAVAADAERVRVVAELEGKARAAEREAAAARAEQEAAVSCTRGIVEAVRNEYQTHAAAELDAAALVEARDALEAARRRCAELDAARAEAVAARAEAVAALEAKNTAAESEMAAARDDVVTKKNGSISLPVMSDVLALFEGCHSSSEVAVFVVRQVFEARAKELVSSTRRVMAAKASVEAARLKCAELSARRACVDSDSLEDGEDLHQELVATHCDFIVMMERYLEVEAAVNAEEDSEKENPWELLVSDLSRELIEACERLKTMQQVNRMLREKFRSEMYGWESSV
ncbi:conserved hypothetical protein [Leishmania braziliensis MHOM/BR/75/M2904]|uniref:Uncharacterized protein n=1 Tax=Leishmania braziliensis TaxID=5660 RepID=A4HAX3_LEIBR|nr:conserved hypothetical protein [Leishmania braziliensis MHOM/BR/75/M2904]CAM38558.1 conserved hypothetical protein [Leishmania braziliensis MHOM/BR/75/M2904]